MQILFWIAIGIAVISLYGFYVSLRGKYLCAVGLSWAAALLLSVML